jgi:uncharacterized OB-fold protein
MGERYGDPISGPFWEAARERRLLLQRCDRCAAHQHYPRALCAQCGTAGPLAWSEAQGRGTVYSLTTVHIPVSDHVDPPYRVAVITLVEGPRMLAGLLGPPVGIGDEVGVTWLDRHGAPPLPMFARV